MQAVVVEGGKRWTMSGVTYAVGVGTREGIHRRPGCEECGAVDVGKTVMIVWFAFLFCVCVCDVVQTVCCAVFEIGKASF